MARRNRGKQRCRYRKLRLHPRPILVWVKIPSLEKGLEMLTRDKDGRPVYGYRWFAGGSFVNVVVRGNPNQIIHRGAKGKPALWMTDLIEKKSHAQEEVIIHLHYREKGFPSHRLWVGKSAQKDHSHTREGMRGAHICLSPLSL